MKKVLRLFIGLCFLLCYTGTVRGQHANTEPAYLVLGYCNAEVANEGKGYDAAGLVSAAVYFPEERMQRLSGNKITKVKYGLVQNRMTSITVFIKDTLTGKALYQQTTVEKPQKGWNEMVLERPYIIEGKGIYVGIEYNQISKVRSFSFTGSEKPYSAFLAYNNDWIDFYGNGYGSLSLQCVVEGEGLPRYDVSLSNVKTKPYVSDGTAFSVDNEFGNFGTETIKEIDFTYRINDDEPVTVHKEVDLPTGSFHNLPIDNIVCPAGQINTIQVRIGNPNGEEDENPSDNEQAARVFSYDKSYARTNVVEQFTTEGCTNCPASIAFLESVLDERADVIWIAHHAGYGVDKYTIEASEDILPFYGAGGRFAPAMMIDRTAFEPETFPVTGISTSEEYMNNILSVANEVPAFVTVDVVADYEESTGKLSIEVSGDVMYIAGNDPRITIYITEDSLYSTTQSGIREIYHNHVPRIALTESYGDSLTIENNRYTVSRECTVSKDWNPRNLYIVGIISNYDKRNVNNRKILNAAAVPLIKPTSLSDLTSTEIRINADNGKVRIEGDYDSFEIYTLTGQTVPNDHLIKGVYLIRIKQDAVWVVKKIIVR